MKLNRANIDIIISNSLQKRNSLSSRAGRCETRRVNRSERETARHARLLF